MLSHDELFKAIMDVALFTDGTYVLRSGEMSSMYLDKYQFESNPLLLRAIVKRLEQKISTQTEVLIGLELGGIPLATALSLHTAIPVCFARKEAKKYGLGKQIEGISIMGKKVVVVEDIVTTGGAILSALDGIELEGGQVESVVCVIDRNQGAVERLKERGVQLISLWRLWS